MERASKLFSLLGLDTSLMKRRAAELSGGQQQRVALAAAFAADPRLIVADEAASALDVSVQAQVLELLDRHQEEAGTAYLFISHDLAVVRYLADDILVMCDGHMAEYGPVDAVLSAPSHPYTEALLAAVPTFDPDRSARSDLRVDLTRSHASVAGAGCFFAARCPRYLGAVCSDTPPPARSDPAVAGHVILCHVPLEVLALPDVARGRVGAEMPELAVGASGPTR